MLNKVWRRIKAPRNGKASVHGGCAGNMRVLKPVLASCVVLMLAADVAHAGMPFYNFSEMATIRIETISFFLVAILVISFAVQRLWNFLQKDFTKLPRLSYTKSVGLILIWGLAFHIVLTMISGARELMTPAAWEKHGLTYKLKQARPAPPVEQLDLARRQQLERLRAALWQYAATHEKKFPPHEFVPDIPQQTWRVLDPSRMTYVYISGGSPDIGSVPLAYEPGIYGRERLVLLTNGEIRLMDTESIMAAITNRGT